MTNCYNTGAVTGSGNVGGVAGYIYNSSSLSFCYNTGAVTGSGNVGGVAGVIDNASSLSFCYNTGAVTGGNHVGGVAGHVYNSSSLTNCYNTGTVSGSGNHVGGVAGYVFKSSVINCYNTGAVTGYDYIGGVVAFVSNSSVTNCYNTGTVAGSEYVGGVAGYIDYIGSVTNCFNMGAVTGSSNVGGVAGYVTGINSSVTNCYFLQTQNINTGLSGVGNGADATAAFDGTGAFTSPYTNVYGGHTSLISALNAWVTANSSGDYNSWVKVTFDTAGGSTILLQAIFVGGVAVIPPSPDKTDLFFGGWYSDPDCLQAWDFDTAVMSNTTIYTKWTGLPLSGTAEIDKTNPRIGDTLTARLTDSNNTGALSYEWFVGGVSVGTGETYTVQAADFGKVITVKITSSVQTGEISSAATAAVVKNAAPAAPAAPTLDSKTHNSVKLTEETGYEYSRDGTSWQASNVFSGLEANTPYTFYQRIAETSDTYASAASAVLNEATEETPAYGVTLDPSTAKTFTEAIETYEALSPHSVTINNTGNQPTGELTIALSGTNKDSFTLSKTSIESIAVSGSGSFTVVPKTGLSAGTYTATVTVTGNNGISETFNVSFTVNALVNAQTPTIDSQPTGATVNVGGTASLTVAASVTDSGTLSCQWYSNTTNSTTGGTLISGATKATYSAPTTTAGTYYFYCVITNTNNEVNGTKTATATTNAVTVTVNAATYTITVTGGMANPTSGATGTSVTLTAGTAPTGKRFKEWSVISGGVTLTGNTFTIGTANVVIEAVWEDIPAEIVYNIIDGADGEWKRDSSGGFTVTADGEFNQFDGVKVNGNFISADNYTVTSGSTVVTLKKEYLNTLANGSYTIEILFKDGGKASTTLTIAAATDGGNDGLSGGAIAGIIIGSVLIVGLGGFAIFWFVIKKKKFADLIAVFKKSPKE